MTHVAGRTKLLLSHLSALFVRKPAPAGDWLEAADHEYQRDRQQDRQRSKGGTVSRSSGMGRES